MADDAGGDAYVEIQVDRETLVLAAVGVLVLLVLAFLIGRWTAPGRPAGETDPAAVPLAGAAGDSGASAEPSSEGAEEEVDGTPQFGAVPVGQPAPARAVPPRVVTPPPAVQAPSRTLLPPPLPPTAAPAQAPPPPPKTAPKTAPKATPKTTPKATPKATAKPAPAPKATPPKDTAAAGAVTTSAASTGSHVVQVGALDSKDQADRLVQKLQAAGHVVRVLDEQGLFKVQVGPFATKAEAEAAERKLKREGHSTWVRRS